MSLTFRRGYVWTRETYTEASNRERIEKLREKMNPKRNENQLLGNESLAKYNWRPASHMTSPDCRGSNDLAIHYRALTMVVVDEAVADAGRFEVPQGVPTASTYGLQSRGSCPRAWGPRIADEDLNEVIR